MEPNLPAERLQKIIAAAGIASRRKAEQLISAGHVLSMASRSLNWDRKPIRKKITSA